MRRDFETRVSGSVFAEFALTTVFANGGVHELILRSYHACPYLQLEHTAAGAAGSLDIATAATLTRVPEAPEFSTGRVRGLLAIGELAHSHCQSLSVGGVAELRLAIPPRSQRGRTGGLAGASAREHGGPRRS